jgi:hypothetical protein
MNRWIPPKRMAMKEAQMMAACVANALIYGFATWLPGPRHRQLLKYSFLMTLGAPVGTAVGALTAHSLGRD